MECSSEGSGGNDRRARRERIVASNEGTDAEGRPLISPVSVLTCVSEADGREYQTRAADTVRISVNTLWSHSVSNVALPIERIFTHVPLAPALLRHWLRDSDGTLEQGGLSFPVAPLDMESRDARIQVQKHRPQEKGTAALGGSGTMQVDIGILFFRREIPPETLSDLDPFESSVWDGHEESYTAWCYMHSRFVLALEVEMQAMMGSALPHLEDVRKHFRQMMRAHYNDCGFLFGRAWWAFGLRDFIEEPLEDFMRRALLGMFLGYHGNIRGISATLELPPCFEAVTVNPGQRVCAQCLTFKLGSGQMKRCECHQVHALQLARPGLDLKYCCRRCITAQRSARGPIGRRTGYSV
jgi:hypothetical protein